MTRYRSARRLVAAGLALALGLAAGAQSSWGGHGGGRGGRGRSDSTAPAATGQPAKYNPDTAETLTGTVQSIGTMSQGKFQVTTLTLKTATESVTVELGPQDFIDKQSFKLVLGDTVLVRGSRAKIYETTVVLAAEVFDKGDSLKLRDPGTGKPLWLAENPESENTPADKPAATPH